MAVINPLLITQVRYYINDIASSSWTDAQLKQFIALAAIHVINDTNKFGGSSYAVTLDSTDPTITPDPAIQTDLSFANLTALQTSCIIARSNIQTHAATAGFKIVDDRSQIDTRDVIKNLEGLAGSVCEAYEAGVQAYKEGNRFEVQAILPPYASPEGTLPSITSSNDQRGG